jgi:single-stranded-DNA-specific exonuclease
MNQKWIQKPHNEEAVYFLEDLDYDPTIANILAIRGVETQEDLDKFFDLSIESLHSPFLLPDAKKAIKRIIYAIKNNQMIYVWGDYDVDGITSTTVIVRALRILGVKNLKYHVPHRVKDGYDIKEKSVERMVEEGAELIISVDCGVVAFEAANKAKELGVDLIITDHHTPDESGEIPDCLAVVNPKVSGTYPFKELEGVGIAFKLMTGLAYKIKFPVKKMMRELIEFVALGTVADVAPMVDENRILVTHGCKALNISNKPGIKSLMKVSRTTKVDSTNIGFTLGPRINAVGRLKDSRIALDLMLATKKIQADILAEEMEQTNLKRQKIQAKAFSDVLQYIDDNNIDPHKDKCVVISSKEWPAGVVGLIAGKLSEKYSVPALVANEKDDGNLKGSCRSSRGINILDALKSKNCLPFFARKKDGHYIVGGHSFAAGFEIPSGNIDNFKSELSKYIKDRYQDINFDEKIYYYDTKINFSKISSDLCKELRQLEPFGAENEVPVFLVKNCYVKEVSTISDGKHLKFSIKSNLKSFDGGATVSAMWWNNGVELEKYKDAKVIDVLAKIDISYDDKYVPSLFLEAVDIKE